jgi:hypothetical protein
MSLTSNEINVIKVKNLIRKVKEKKIAKSECAKELNRRFERMKKDDSPWYEDLYPKFVSVMKE